MVMVKMSTKSKESSPVDLEDLVKIHKMICNTLVEISIINNHHHSISVYLKEYY